MKKITSSQFISVLFVTRAFLSVTYGVSENHINVVLSMLSIAVSVLVEGVLIIPPIVFANLYPDKDFLQLSYKKSKGLGNLLSVVYACFFIYEASRQMGIFSYFLKTEFLDFLPAPVLIIALGCVAVYGASLGLRTLSRTAFVGVCIFVVMFFVIVLGVTGEYEFYNIQMATPYSQSPFRAFFKDVFERIGRSDELVVLPFLLKFTKKNSTGAGFGYMGAKLVVMELMVFYSALILGEYANTLPMPFYTLSTYAKTSIIERYDSIYMWVWTISTIIKVGILVYFGSVCICGLKASLKSKSVGISGALAILLSTALSVSNNYDSVLFQAPSTVIVIALGSVVPFVVLIFAKRGEALRKE